MLFSRIANRAYSYMPLASAPRSDFARPLHSSALLIVALMTGLGLGFIGGFASGLFKLGYPNETERVLNLRRMSGPLHGNESYIGIPTPEKSLAWESLFPSEGGFFTHPTLAPELSVFSAFHQVHCLELIWRQWWAVYKPDSVRTGEHTLRRTHEREGKHHHDAVDPVHMNHCIELLRNVIMCNADLTIEVAKKETKGVTGFGATHECLNWDDLVGWIGRWEVKS